MLIVLNSRYCRANLAGPSFYIHQFKLPNFKQSLSCSIRPPEIELIGVKTILTLGAYWRNFSTSRIELLEKATFGNLRSANGLWSF